MGIAESIFSAYNNFYGNSGKTFWGTSASKNNATFYIKC